MQTGISGQGRIIVPYGIFVNRIYILRNTLDGSFNPITAWSDQIISRTLLNRAGIHFGLTFKSVPLHNQGAYNKETAVKVICISCNEADQKDAWNTLIKWYNSEKPTFPLGIPMMFIPLKDHPDIKNDPAATQNISTLLD